MSFWFLWGMMSCLLLAIGVVNKSIHCKHLRRIPVRININGTRGKSTVTRLITAALKEAGCKVIGKTTGSDARLIFWNRAHEEPLVRKTNQPNISEVCKVVGIAAKNGAEFLVCECMAVKPEYQTVFARQLVQNNIGVIVNTLPDHLDVMGPTTRNVANALSSTIPWDGEIILIKDEFCDFYRQIAEKRRSKVRIADPASIPPAYIEQFEYLVFPENVALALETVAVLGVDRDVAMRGMLKAAPDPGALTVSSFQLGYKNLLFANAFAANDPVSTMVIYRRLVEMDYDRYPLAIIVNCRSDRVDRTKQMAQDVLPNLPCSHIIVIGSAVGHVRRCYSRGLYRCDHFWDLENASGTEIIAKLAELPNDSLLMGIGNIHGAAEDILHWFDDQRSPESWPNERREKSLVHL